MVSLIAWQGDETILDIGTGRGLLLIGAAKRLKKSHAKSHDPSNKGLRTIPPCIQPRLNTGGLGV